MKLDYFRLFLLSLIRRHTEKESVQRYILHQLRVKIDTCKFQ